MTTFNEMVLEVSGQLAGYTRSHEQSTHLTQAIDTDDTQFTVADPSRIGRGVVEVGDELLWVDSFDAQNLTVTVPPYGRGFNGTTAASHSSGARATLNPPYPRVRIKKAINDTIRAVAGDLYAVGSDEFTFVASQVAYDAPSDLNQILSIWWETYDSTQYWQPVTRWRYNHSASSGFATGKSLDIYDPVMPGRTVRVVYAFDPSPMSADADVFTTATGLEASHEDVIVYGALARLTAAAEAQRLDQTSLEADMLDEPNPIGSAQALSRYYFALHRQRLDEERRKLLDKHPVTVHYAR